MDSFQKSSCIMFACIQYTVESQSIDGDGGQMGANGRRTAILAIEGEKNSNFTIPANQGDMLFPLCISTYLTSSEL